MLEQVLERVTVGVDLGIMQYFWRDDVAAVRVGSQAGTVTANGGEMGLFNEGCLPPVPR